MKEEKEKLKTLIGINQYLDEKSDYIFNTMENNKSILINSKMKTGKTTFITKNLKEYCLKKGYKLIFIIPTVNQLQQLQKRYDIPIQCTTGKADKLNQFVATTPDSLPKIIKHCEEMKQQFVMVIDEVQEIESSYNHRRAFKNIINNIDHLLCKNIISLSATPYNVILSDTLKFDKEIKIKVKHKFLNANKFEIIQMKKCSSYKSIATYLKFLGKKYKQVFFKVDNKKTLEKVTKLLNNFVTIEEDLNGVAYYLNSDNRKNNLINKAITNDEIIEDSFKYVGFTSLINSGIEIQTGKNVAVVNFTTETFNFINEIQFIGRFRSGVQSYYLVVEEPKENIKNSFIHYEEKKEMIIAITNDNLNHFNEMYKKYKNLYGTFDHRLILKDEYSHIYFDEEKDQYCIDKIILNAYIYKEFIMQYINFHNKLLALFERDTTFISKDYLISKFDIENKEINEEVKNLEEKKKVLKKEEKEILNKTLEFLNNLSDSDLNNMLLNLWDIETMSTEYKEHYDIWKELGEKQRYSMKELIKYIENLSTVQAFKIATTRTNKQSNNIIDSKKAVLLNQIYNINPNDLIRKNKKSLDMRLKITRDFMNSKGYEKNGQRITEELLNELAKYQSKYGIMEEDKIFAKEKKLTKATTKTLESLIKIIYRCSNENKLRISSIRKDIDDLIQIKKCFKNDTENISSTNTNKQLNYK